MSMRIDRQQQTAQTEATRLETSRQNARTADRTGAKTDRLEVSKDAQLVSTALKTASSTPDIRADVVERAKKALEAGQVGNDSQALANKMLDNLLG
jgi:flagellar biosynthesis anti-sigma factor FlgM